MKPISAWKEWYVRHEISPKYFQIRKNIVLDAIETGIKTGLNSPLRILDVGCGKAELFNALTHDSKYEFYGADILRDLLLTAHNQVETARFVCSDVFNLPFKDNFFDIAIFTELLHHLTGYSRSKSKRNVSVALREAKRVCKPNSQVIIIDRCVITKIQSHLVFLLTTLSTMLNLSIPLIKLQRGLVISFYTSQEMIAFLNDNQINLRKMEKWRGSKSSLKSTIRRFLADSVDIYLIGTIYK